MRRGYVLFSVVLLAPGAFRAEPPVFRPAQKSFWSLQPVTNPSVPPVRARAWVKNPIDAFVLAKLEEKGLQPNRPAARLTLLRRVSIDLTGLPPAQEAIDAFVADKSPDAYAKVVDRLLASP